MASLNEFIAYLNGEVANHSIYVIGAQGQRGKAVTEKFIRQRESASETNANRAVKFWEKQVEAGYGDVLGAFDCSGLGMYWIQNLKGIYPTDLNANGMYGVLCSTHPTKEQLRCGDWVFKRDSSTNRITHIGYIVDSELNVIECRGRDYGVVKGALDSRWTDFGRPDCFKEEIEQDVNNDFYPVITQNLKSGLEGTEVKALQITLVNKGYNISTDGKFGAKTKQVVIDFQKDAELKADGVAGKDTVNALGLIWGKGLTNEQIIKDTFEKWTKAEQSYIEKLEVANMLNIELSQMATKQKEEYNAELAQYKSKLTAAESKATVLTTQYNLLKADMAEIKAIADKY